MRRLDFQQTYKLIGGFNAMLTASEVNRWHEFIEDHPTHKAWNQSVIDGRAACAALTGGDPTREADYRAAEARHDVLLAELYAIGKAWYAELTAGDEARNKAEEEEFQHNLMAVATT